MATADRFAASSEEEIAKILSEKDAENTKRCTKSAVYGSQAVSLLSIVNFKVIYVYHFLSVVNFSFCCHIHVIITFCLLSILDCCHKGITFCPLFG